jgi:hypothetical protein
MQSGLLQTRLAISGFVLRLSLRTSILKLSTPRNGFCRVEPLRAFLLPFGATDLFAPRGF